MTQLKIFGYLSGALALIAFIPYYRDIFRGKTKPERASWLIWGCIDLVALFTQLAEGASYSLFLPIAYAIGDFGVFFLAFKYGYGNRLLRRDKFALAGVAASLIIWYISREAAIALIIVIFIDWIAGVLNIMKSYEAPRSETMSKWVLNGIAALFAGIAVGSLDVTLLLFPVSTFLLSLATVVAIQLGSKRPSPKIIENK